MHCTRNVLPYIPWHHILCDFPYLWVVEASWVGVGRVSVERARHLQVGGRSAPLLQRLAGVWDLTGSCGREGGPKWVTLTNQLLQATSEELTLPNPIVPWLFCFWNVTFELEKTIVPRAPEKLKLERYRAMHCGYLQSTNALWVFTIRCCTVGNYNPLMHSGYCSATDHYKHLLNNHVINNLWCNILS